MQKPVEANDIYRPVSSRLRINTILWMILFKQVSNTQPYSGIFRAGFHKIGKKSFNGFVKFIDREDKRQIVEFKLRFEVIPNVDSLPKAL